MITLLVFAFLILMAAVPNGERAFVPARPQPLQTVAYVNPEKYIGTWFEIARLPNNFQKDCVSDVRANYNLRSDGKIGVTNRCLTAKGTTKTAKGKAKITDPSSNSKLKVTFFWPFSGDYWILDLDQNYTYAIVGEPKRKYLWILSRSPEIGPDLYKELVTRIEKMGYETSKLTLTKHRGKNIG